MIDEVFPIGKFISKKLSQNINIIKLLNKKRKEIISFLSLYNI